MVSDTGSQAVFTVVGQGAADRQRPKEDFTTQFAYLEAGVEMKK